MIFGNRLVQGEESYSSVTGNVKTLIQKETENEEDYKLIDLKSYKESISNAFGLEVQILSYDQSDTEDYHT